MQQRRADQIRGVARPELAHRLGAMALERARAYLHPQRALLVRIALADQPQHFALRRRVGMVFQRATPFAGTVADNLAVR